MNSFSLWRIASALLVVCFLPLASSEGEETPRSGGAPSLPPLPQELKPASPWKIENAFPDLRFEEPVYLCATPRDGDSLYVVERPGRIMRVAEGAEGDEAEVFLNLTGAVQSDAGTDNGLIGLAFHPEFGQEESRNRGFFYVYYTTRIGGMAYYRLSRFTLPEGAARAERMSETILIQQHDEHPIHNGGSLQFGGDGFLYLSVGDEGGQGDPYQSSQKISEDLFSGILRVDVDRRGGGVSHPPPRQPATGRTAHYYIPNDNPFVGMPGALEEFWAIGLRSPHRMSFDAKTGRLWLGAVGQDHWESIEWVGRGTNHQWSYREGFAPYTKSYLRGERPRPYLGEETRPIYAYPHANGNRCIIGGYVYRGSKLPRLYGEYIFGDLGSGRVWALEASGGGVTAVQLIGRVESAWRTGPSSFGVDGEGEVYICTLGSAGQRSGRILKITRDNTGVP